MKINSLFFFVLALGIILISYSCKMSSVKLEGEKRINRPDQESWDVKITLTNEGFVRSIIQAGYLKKYQQRSFIFLEDSVNVDFFSISDKKTTNIKSNMAEINEKNNFMKAIESVVVKSDSGVTLFTDTLSWNSTKRLIYTDDSVHVITNKQDTLYGIGFESDVEMKHWKILQPSGVTNRIIYE